MVKANKIIHLKIFGGVMPICVEQNLRGTARVLVTISVDVPLMVILPSPPIIPIVALDLEEYMEDEETHNTDWCTQYVNCLLIFRYSFSALGSYSLECRNGQGSTISHI